MWLETGGRASVPSAILDKSGKHGNADGMTVIATKRMS